MQRKQALIALGVSVVLASTSLALAHSGRTNSSGCHNNRRTGDYHCHGGGASRTAPKRSNEALASYGGGAFRNCAAARAAGAAPVRRGDPGYGAHLDRDDDGVGCE